MNAKEALERIAEKLEWFQFDMSGDEGVYDKEAAIVGAALQRLEDIEKRAEEKRWWYANRKYGDVVEDIDFILNGEKK